MKTGNKEVSSLLLIACGVLALLIVWRGARGSSGGDRR